MATLSIKPIPLLEDNYAWLLHESASNTTAVVDPSSAEPVAALLRREGLKLDFILNTHHHPDHTGGNEALKAAYSCQIIGPRYDQGRIPGMDCGVAEGEVVAIGQAQAQVIYIPGHTSGHIAFWFSAEQAVFCGDTLFSLGCGRLFEGTPTQMWQSLSKLAALPATTKVYCGHEYTAANARFALSVDAGNQALAQRQAEVASLRQSGLPTVPSLLGVELAANPFLRAGNAAAFAALRLRKDEFR